MLKNNRARVYVALGRLDDALAQLQAGDSPGAIDSLTRALAVTEDAALLFNRAAAYGSADRWADAKADLTRARELDPEDPEISAELTACEERLGVRL